MKTTPKLISLFLFILLLNSYTWAAANPDWPMWRHDHSRSGVSEMSLPDNPVLLWTRQMEEPRRGWPFQYEDYYTGGNPVTIGKLSFDISFEPVMADGKLFVPSMVSDRVIAYSADNGEEIWRYYVGGPVRFAPVYDQGRLYVTSDDGYLYCLDASTGDLLWNYHGSYSNRMVMGNERIISMWPARGGPVIMDGIIYFAAGVIPFEGVFIHAVDATSGEKIWTNSTSGVSWDLHQHGGAYSFGGPSPQGYLAISGDKLIVPGGRTPPAVFDRNTGELLYFNQATGMVGKGAGGYRVFAAENWFFNHGMLYALEDGAQFGHVPGDIITKDAFIGIYGDTLFAHKSELKTVNEEVEDRLQRGAIKKKYEIEELWNSEVPDVKRLYLKTNSHFVISKKEGETLALIDINQEGMPDKVAWEHKIDGEIWSIIAGDNKLYVVTRQGKIYCFGAGTHAPVMHYAHKIEQRKPHEKYAGLAASIIKETGVTNGYGMIYGGENSDLIETLAKQSAMHIVIIEPDKQKADMLRQRFDKAGIYGKRVAVINADKDSYKPLPYIYDLVILDGSRYSGNIITRAFSALRPYGGKAYILDADENISQTFGSLNLENGKLSKTNDFAIITREGALPGSDQWTHQYGGASNRTYSNDELVRPPFGTLWFGSTSNLDALPRHHNGPIPQVAGGRLIILGVETISARCVYTGREIWKKEIPGIGHPFTNLELEEQFRAGNEVYMSNNPGANFIGSPYVSLEDAVYVMDGSKLMSLDAATGDVMIELRLPDIPDIEIAEFSHLLVEGDYLITTIDPQFFDDGKPGETNWNATSSNVLLVLDRKSGELLWSKRAETGFRHNAIAAGNGKLFIVDGLSEGALEILQRRGMEKELVFEIMALDLKTGQEIWAMNDNVFGTWLGYYNDKDILLQGGRRGQRGAPKDEPNEKLIAHNGSTGEIMWGSSNRYSGPLGLHPDMIIPGRPGEPAFNPSTGEIILKDHPLTGEDYRWGYHKYYGCGTMNSSKYLITFRTSTAGFTDLLNYGGTAPFGGFKAGCTNNMVAADGVLNIPEYTRTCTCSYPLQTSFGLVHMPDAGIEMWTLNRLDVTNEAISSLGINFAGQGNRRENGVLWLEYPKVYPEGPDIPVKIESGSHDWFRNHSTWIENGEEKYDWVASYGAKGISSVSIDLVPEDYNDEKYYNVTLYFAEPDDLPAGERLFDVSLQGEKVLKDFDIVAQAGGARRTLKKVFNGVRVKDELLIELSGNINKTVISGIEIVMEGHTADSF